jgi:hypothetical protein
MEHLADEFNTRGLVGILFLEVHDQAECAILEGGVGGANDDGIPKNLSDIGSQSRWDVGLPCHHIIGHRGCRDASWGISLHAL